MDSHDYPDFGSVSVRALDLPRIRAQAARRNSLLATRRAPVMLAEGIGVALRPEGTVDWAESGKSVDIAFGVAGEVGYVTIPLPVVQRLLARTGIGVHPGRLDAELAAMAIETVLADRIEALEQAMGGEVVLLELDRTAAHDSLARMAFELHMDDVVFPGSIHASAALLSALGREWGRQPAMRAEPDDLTFTISCRVAFTDLSASALRVLSVGDAMLFDRIAKPGGAAVILAEAMNAIATFNDEGFLFLSEPFRAPEPYGMGDFLMSDENDPERPVQAITDSAIDDLPVRLVFEVARKDLTLDELRSLAVGASVPLDRPASSTVQIFANGRRIGAGEMVMIGEQLGMRITQLNTNA